MFLDKINFKPKYAYGLIYTVCFLAIAGVMNYLTWTEGPVMKLRLQGVLIWLGLYLPFLFYQIYDNWKIREFGFVLNYRVLFLLLIFFIFLLFNYKSFSFNNYYSASIEAFARTGEELFFRGFLYALILRMLENKENSRVWAIIISSAFFALVHVQTFLPSYSATMIDIFILGLAFAVLRILTNSILPGTILHIGIKSNMSGILLGIIVHFLFIALSILKDN